MELLVMCWVVWIAFSETDKIMSIPNACWHILSAEWKSKELLPCQLPLVANVGNELWWVFPSWCFDLDWNWAGHYTSVSPIATSTINPTDRCDNFDFFACGNREEGAKCQSPSFIQPPFCGRGASQKIPQKSFSAAKLNIPLRTCRKPQLWWNLEFLKRPGCGKSIRPDVFFKVQKLRKPVTNLQDERLNLSYWPT